MKPTLRVFTISLIVLATCEARTAWAAEPSSQVSGTLYAEPSGSVSIQDRAVGREIFGPPLQGPGEVVLRQGGPNSIGRAVAVPFGPWINLDGRFGEGIGYRDSYFNARAFIPRHIDPGRNLFFGMISGGTTEEAEPLLNVGGGYRHYVESLDRVFGASAWFTGDDSNEETYYRAGANFESLGRYFDLFFNVYYVLNSSRELLSEGITGDPFFRQNNILFPFQQTFEAPYSGGDFEVGGLVPFIGRHGIYGYVGGYYLDSSETGFEDTTGVKVRSDVAVSEDFSVGVNYSYDDTFGANTWVSVALQFPLKPQRRWFKPRKVRTRLASNVNRQDRIPVLTKRFDNPEIAVDPFDGKDIFVYHVDPNLTAPGNGTFENPFNMLQAANDALALPGDMTDIVRVLPRADETGTNLALTAPFALNDRVRLLSTTVPHTFDSTRGTFVLPGFTGSAPGPLVTNPGAGTEVIQLANSNEVSGFIIDGSGQTRTGIAEGTTGFVDSFDINRNTLRDGIYGMRLDDARGTGVVDQNVAIENAMDGLQINVSSAPVGGGPTLALTMTNNVSGDNGGNGITLNLSGSATASLVATNNVFGSGGQTDDVFSAGLNFTGTVFGDANATGIPPDTMGGVGPNHIVEFINTKFTVYNKTTGAEIETSSLDQFFVDAGVAGASGLFDPRIVFDVASGRWFATAIDGGDGNSIFIAVSATSDPTSTWTGFSFVGDSVDGSRFNDFDTFGLDADGVYISTNNFGGPSGFDVSIYSIPKADLLAGAPTIANLSRFENLDFTVLGSSIQPAVDFGPSDGRAALLAADDPLGSSELHRTDVNGAGGAGATLSATTDIAVPAYTAGPSAEQPGPKPNLENVSPRFVGNVFEQGDSLWAAHAVEDPATGRSAIRWYEIDENTNAVLQTGLISDPTLDFIMPSISANAAGSVVIGFTGTGETQFASSYAVNGSSVGGVTTFGAPLLLKAGVSDYFVDFGFGRNRWGDYSATVVDPSDPDVFWTFQEFVAAEDTWAVQITQLTAGSISGGNTGDGMFVNLKDSSKLIPSLIDSNTFNDNGAVGLNVLTEDTSMVQSTTVSGNTANGNTTGALFTAEDTSTIDVDLIGNTFNGNTGMNTGVSALAEGGTITIGSFTGNTISDNMSGNGVRLEATMSGELSLTGFTGNTITGNGLNGVLLTASDVGSLVDATLGTSGAAMNTITGNGVTGTGHGIRGETSAVGTVRGAIVNNTITDHAGGAAISFSADTGTIDFGSIAIRSIAENTLTGNSEGGVIASGTGAPVFDFSIDSNTIGTEESPNTGPGIDVSAEGTIATPGFLDLTATDNAIDSAIGVGIGYTQIQNTTGAFTITGNTIVRTADDADLLTAFMGDAIRIRQIGGAFIPPAVNSLTASTIDANLIGSLTDATLGNAGYGIIVETGETSALRDLTIGNTDGDNDNGNIIANNGVDGVRVRRSGNAIVDRLRAVDNNVADNAGDGFSFEAAGTSFDLIDVLAEDNRVTDNGDDGFDLFVVSDGNLDIDIIDNFIHSNADNGIFGHSLVTNGETELRAIRGVWHTNIITNNVGHGILSSARTSSLSVGLGGTDAEGKSRSNLIDLNGKDGVEINSSGTATYTNNVITRNGIEELDDDTQGGGVDIQGALFKSITLNSNVIKDNFGDGLEIANFSNSDKNSLIVTATGNVISGNTGRGVDVLNRDDGVTTVTLTSNGINGNGLEGIFVVNTASDTQDQVGAIDSAADLAQDGAIGADPRLRLSVNSNTIIGNGFDSNFIGTGLVLLVGTAGGGYGFDDDGGFADTRAGVRADVTGNTMVGGNLGVDVYIQSFVSTGEPPDTAGTWSDTEFEVEEYDGDPLARLDLVFTGNSGESFLLTPDFTESSGTLAFYDNAEAVFKSRDVDQTDPGPFPEGGDRRRNAQRLAARLGLDPATPGFDAGSGQDSDDFLYAGIGQSTFRADASGNFFTLGIGFVFDDTPYDDVGDAMGAPFPGTVLFGELPWGWTDADRAADFDF